MLETVQKISRYLNVDLPSDLLLGNLNDCDSGFGVSHQLADLVRLSGADWVILDPISGVFPGVDKDNNTAATVFADIRRLMSETGCAFTFVHHIKKPSDDPSKRPPPLETSDLKEWFYQCRGARVLVNGSDVRIAFDGTTQTAGADVIVRGFERLEGEFPAMFLARVMDPESGKPVGYRLLEGLDLLKNPDHRRVFAALPDIFQFKNASAAYGKSDSATTNFLGKCEGAGVLRKRPDGKYEKVTKEGPPNVTGPQISPGGVTGEDAAKIPQATDKEGVR